MNAVLAESRVTSPWRAALPAFLLLVAAIALLYRDTAAVMVGVWWRSETFAHCFMVVPISLWLVWRRRERLTALKPRPQPWALLALVGAALVWLLSDLVVVNAGAQFAFVAMLLLAVPAVLGMAVTLEILFPLLFLFFAVPFGEFAVPTMMELTADFTVFALQVTGVPVFREGQSFVIPSGTWSVIDECSGVRYLMASFMVGTLFAYLNYRSYLRRAVFMLVALGLPVLANWLRAYLIVMLAHLSGNRLAVGVDHILYGWVFFGLIIFIMFVVGARWSQPDEDGANARDRTRAASAISAAGPMWAVALGGMVIGWLPQLAVAGLQQMEGRAAPARIELPEQLAGGWSSRDARLVAWAPEFGTPSAQVSRAYVAAAGTVGIHLYYYRGQSEGHKVVSSQNMLVGMRDPDWTVPVSSALRDVAAAGQSVSVRTTEILASVQRAATQRAPLVVWRVYWIDGRFIGGDGAAKAAGAMARLRGRGDEGAAIVLYAQGDSVAASNAALQRFVQDNLGVLDLLLQRTHSAR
jgi:exosortase A